MTDAGQQQQQLILSTRLHTERTLPALRGNAGHMIRKIRVLGTSTTIDWSIVTECCQ